MTPRRCLSLAMLSLLSISTACESNDASDDDDDASGGSGGAGGTAGEDGGDKGGGGGESGGSGGESTGGAGGEMNNGGGGGSGGSNSGGGGMGGSGGGGSGGGGAMGTVSGQAFCPMAMSAYTLMLPANPTATLVKGGLRGAEGPVWVAEQNALYFSEIHRTGFMGTWKDPANVTIQKLTPANGMLAEWLPGGTNGMAIIKVDGKWTLITANVAEQAIVLIDLATKAKTNYVTMHNDKTFKATNDLAVSAKGDVYFSDPVWHQTVVGTTVAKEGIYRAARDKTVTLIDDTFLHPNGVSLSPDDKVLYVAGFAPPGSMKFGLVNSYPVNADGSVGAGSVFAHTMAGGVDGMAIDCAGNVYVTVDNGVEVYAPNKMLLGVIKVGPNATDASNAAFGGPDMKTLYITSEPGDNRAIFKIDLNVPGLPY